MPLEVIAIEELGRVWICRTCVGIEETPGPGGPPSYEMAQRCACRGKNQVPWKGFDFNERFHLCECCQQEALSSGRRFHIWFCPECKDRVVDFNDAQRAWLIPIGRHSFMVRSYDPPGQLLAASVDVLRSGDEAEKAREIERLRTGTVKMVSSIDRLTAWSKDRLLRTLDELGFPPGQDVSMTRYLRTVRARSAEDPRYSKEAFFRQLSASILAGR
jgi:hypothetical protein